MKRIVHQRRAAGPSDAAALGPAHIVIASATLNAQRMSDFFYNAPIVRLGSSSHPVQVLYAEKPTASQALVEASLELVMRIHTERARSPGDDILVFLTGHEEIATATHALRELAANTDGSSRDMPDLLVLPIHASLPAAEQAKVFEPAPDGVRKVIIATNVAETSLTLPGVRVVIDPGMVKEKYFDREKGMEILSVVPISKSSACQRAGRAGRTSSGDVYRLYTEAQFKNMAAEQLPEICRTNLANTVLLLKTMGLSNIADIDWLDPPSLASWTQAMRVLFWLGALDANGALTLRGAEMARLPLEPSLSRVLLAAADLQCLQACASMCAMTVGEEPFHRAGPHELVEAAESARAQYDRAEGDHVTMLLLFHDWGRVDPHLRDGWCRMQGVNARAMRTADAVRSQLLGMMQKARHSGHHTATHTLPETEVRRRCRQALCEGYFFQSARRIRGTALFVTQHEPQQTVALRNKCCKALQEADFVVFSELVWAGRPTMQRVSMVEPSWLEPLLPRLRQLDIDRLMGALSQGGSEVVPEARAQRDATCSNLRRNNDEDVASARKRFLERQYATSHRKARV